MVQRTYGAMTNDVLISIPLFVLMGYVMERGALVDKMFYSIQLSFRRVPASLAVATLIVCTFWGIASGLVGAVVVLMGVIALNPMLRAGYDVRLASGVITAGGTLGILIPPSVMIIVFAAVAGQSVVKLYAAAMFPGFFLALLYLVYIVGWAWLNPKIAPRVPEEQSKRADPGLAGAVPGASTRRNILVGLLKALFSPGRAAGAGHGSGPAAPIGRRSNFAQRWSRSPLTTPPSAWSGGTWPSIRRHRSSRGLPAGLEQLGAPQRPRAQRRPPTGPSTTFSSCSLHRRVRGGHAHPLLPAHGRRASSRW